MGDAFVNPISRGQLADAALRKVRGTVGQDLQSDKKEKINRKPLPPKVEEALNLTQKYLVTPAAFFSLGTGILSFISANLLKAQNEFLEKAATIFSKGAIISNAIYGGLENASNNDLFGILGYVMDFITSIKGKAENLYLLRGLGSALDQVPALLRDVAKNPGIQAKYNPANNPEYDFNDYDSLTDSGCKTLQAARVIFSDLINDFKSGKSLKNIFVNGERTAEKNLLLSSLGIFSGALVGIIFSFNKYVHLFGATVRDVSGAYADLALYDKGDSKDASGNKTGAGNFNYMVSGIFYVIGSILDLFYRWTKIPCMNLLALGTDRVGARFMVVANADDNKQIRKNRNGNGA